MSTEAPARVGILGLGRIGRVVAANLQAGGFSVATVERPNSRDFPATGGRLEADAALSLLRTPKVRQSVKNAHNDNGWRRRRIWDKSRPAQRPHRRYENAQPFQRSSLIPVFSAHPWGIRKVGNCRSELLRQINDLEIRTEFVESRALERIGLRETKTAVCRPNGVRSLLWKSPQTLGV